MRVTEYLDYWQNLTPRSIWRLAEVAVPEFRFTDPFNNLNSVKAVERMLERMFKHLPTAKFTVRDTATSGNVLYIRWHFHARPGWDVEGMSEVHFGPDGRAISHLDHWDAAGQFYERLPILGGILRLIRRRV